MKKSSYIVLNTAPALSCLVNILVIGLIHTLYQKGDDLLLAGAGTDLIYVVFTILLILNLACLVTVNIVTHTKVKLIGAYLIVVYAILLGLSFFTVTLIFGILNLILFLILLIFSIIFIKAIYE